MESSLVERYRPFFPAFLFALFILYLSTLDGRDLPEVDIVNADKLIHAGCYAVFTYLICLGFHKSVSQTRPWLSALIAAVYGLVMEWIQGTFFPYRTADMIDAAANGIGALAAALIVPFLLKN